MEISYQLTRDDYEEYLCAAHANAKSLAGTSGSSAAWILAIYVPLGIAAVGFSYFFAEYSGPGVEILYLAVAGLVWFFIAILVWNWLGKKRYLMSMVADDGWFLKPATLTLMPHGLANRAGKLGFELPWSEILAMQQTGNLILLFFDGAGALVIPKRAFPDKEKLAEFISVLEAGIGPSDDATTRGVW